MSFSASQKQISIASLLVLGAGLALTIVLYAWQMSSEADRLRKAREHGADIRQAAFQEEFDDTLHGLAVVNRLFSGNEEDNRAHFHDVAVQLVQSYPYIHSFSYARTVRGDQRRGFEMQLQSRKGGMVVTGIKDGQVVPAGDRPRYHVIDSIAPSAPNSKVVGLDISYGPGKEAALQRARTSGLPSATGLFNLTVEESGERAFAIVLPVYRTGAAGQNAKSREESVAGYTLVVLHATAFVESVMRSAAFLHPHDPHVSIFVDDGTSTELVYSTDASVADMPPDSDTTSITRRVEAAGLSWLIVSRSGAPGAGMSQVGWLMLVGGTSISILFALYLQSLAMRASYLSRANARLRKDIDVRKRIEEALRASEERFERLARMSSDWYWEQDAEFRFTMISGETIFGDTPTSELLGKPRDQVPLEVDEKAFEEHLQVLKARKPFTDLEYRVRDKSGRVHWMAVSGEPLFTKNGEFVGYRGTGKNITERKEAEQALRQSQTELRELAAHQARVKEDERKRIAREIHDDLGQNLLALRIDASLLESETRGRLPDINERIHGLLSQVDNVVRSIRAIVNDLRPPVLDLGLQCAVEWQVQQFRQRSGVSCTLDIEGGDIDGVLDEEAATSVFRILQESLTNVSRHAYATHVDIRLERKYDSLTLEIADDGVGNYPGNMRKPRSFGLIGIRERVLRLGGEFHLASAPGKGTRLAITIPASVSSAAAA